MAKYYRDDTGRLTEMYENTVFDIDYTRDEIGAFIAHYNRNYEELGYNEDQRDVLLANLRSDYYELKNNPTSERSQELMEYFGTRDINDYLGEIYGETFG